MAAMFDNVLVGVDGRPGGRDAIALAAKLLEPGGSITLVRVYGGAFMPSHVVDTGLIDADRKAARDQLERDRDALAVDAELLVTQGATAGRVLHELAEERHTSLLVVGSSHRGVLGRAILGDDTRESLNGAPCAVAIAPHGYAEGTGQLETIGVGFDGSPESGLALDVARQLASRDHARVIALRVVAIPSYSYTGLFMIAGDWLDEQLRDADAEMRGLDGVDGRTEIGIPGEDLAIFSGEVDLMIVGSRSYGPAHRVIHGSTSNYLQRHARAPLLVLPRTASVGRADRDESDAHARKVAPA
jgi:nucleotide-binding universal stress UspA family protein